MTALLLLPKAPFLQMNVAYIFMNIKIDATYSGLYPADFSCMPLYKMSLCDRHKGSYMLGPMDVRTDDYLMSIKNLK
jgi:hypothetical protein